MLRSKSLCFEYNDTTQFKFPNIDLAQGDGLLILGESGIGKTTLLHLLGGLIRPKSGSIELDNISLNSMSSAQLDKFRGQNIGLVFQSPCFIQSLSLKDNMVLVQYLGGQKKDTNYIASILDNLGLKDKLNSNTNRLSQGERQRAAIAMAVLNKPQLILADEPTSSLDDKNCSKVVHLLKSQAESSNANLVIITHDQRLKKEFQNVITL